VKVQVLSRLPTTAVGKNAVHLANFMEMEVAHIVALVALVAIVK
jgi:hypothetical protein